MPVRVRAPSGSVQRGEGLIAPLISAQGDVGVGSAAAGSGSALAICEDDGTLRDAMPVARHDW